MAALVTKLNRISTPLTKLLKIDVPILLAPMALANTGNLACAVSATGAFGFMGAGSVVKMVRDTLELTWAYDTGFLSPLELKQNLTSIREKLNVGSDLPVPVGVGFIGWVLEKSDEAEDPRIRSVLEEKVTAIWLAFGVELGKYVKQIRTYDAEREHKTTIFTIVNSVEEALRAANEWKVDVVVAQGIESGGHGGEEAPPLLTLLQAVIDALPNGPLVVAAGGVSTGKQIAALLTMGASGVVLGTRFLFTEECGYTPAKKEVLLKAGFNSTVRTLAFDEVGRTMGWPEKQDGRAVSNNIIQDVEEGLNLDERLRRYDESSASGDLSRLVVWAGVGVALTDKITSASEVVRDLSNETFQSLQSVSRFLGR